MKPLFNIRGEGSFALIMGIISGYPVGAKIACNFRKNNVCSKEECERLLSFTNNSGPLFIVGTVGITMFKFYYRYSSFDYSYSCSSNCWYYI